MSSSSKNGIPTNEEVIEELTKDLKDSAIKVDPSTEDTSHHSESEPESDYLDDDEIKDEDDIDDNLLKERDDKLSEEEKRVSVTIHNLLIVLLSYWITISNANMVLQYIFNNNNISNDFQLFYLSFI